MSQLKRVYATGRRMRDTAVVDDDFPEMLHHFDSALHAVDRMLPMPKIVCLCGSTRFKDAFMEANKRLTISGVIILSVGTFPYTDQGASPEDVLGEDVKKKLDELHKRKIDLADKIFVLNVGGYIGNSTRSEIEYTQSTGKPVKYLEAV